ncbi:MAG: putative signal transducing protein [Fermentimonas sp.]|jgi:hypothetical protein
MEDKLITVKTFTFPADVAVVQSYMEMEGIEVFMKGLTSNMMAFPTGDIEMQVKESDYERAKEALISGGYAKLEDYQQENE